MRIDELYLQQCLILWLITVQKRANKHKLSTIFNAKSTPKINELQNIFYLKRKLNQVFVIALPDWHLLRQVSENVNLDPITY